MRLLPIIPLAVCVSAFALEPSQTIKVWPDGVPGPVNDRGPERVLPVPPGTKQVMRVEGITDPTLLVYPAPKDKACGAAIIICPGGGFSKVVPDLEGSEIAENVNALGVTAFVLKYRTSPAKTADPQLGPVMDAQRSVSLVRARAAEFGLNPDRIGLLGVSAGGQVALIAASNHAKRLHEAKGDMDNVSCRPDFLALVYPWKIQDANNPAKLRADVRVDSTCRRFSSRTPWMIRAPRSRAACCLLLQLQMNKIPAEAHLYAKGGHGFGLRPAAVPCPSDWPQRFAQWLGVTGFTKP